MLIINGVPQADSKDARLFINGEAQVNLWGLPLATGQTTKYVTGDDGDLELGLALAYEIKTTGQYSLTKNIDLIHLTAATISFDTATKEIRDSGNAMAMFKTGRTIVVTGSGATPTNNGTYTVATGNVAAKIVTTEALGADEAAGATVSIAKREAMSNNCVQDLVTGRMWLRYVPLTLGSAGDGLLLWTGLFDIFDYLALVNAASVGGYTDWRVSQIKELMNLLEYEAPAAIFNAAAFPGNPAGVYHSSTTRPDTTTNALGVYLPRGTLSVQTKTSDTGYIMLVRG